MSSQLLAVEDLAVEAPSGGRPVRLVEAIRFHIQAGETLGLVGESGCGKSITAFSILNLLPSPLRIVSGAITFSGRELLGGNGVEELRGREITAVFQEPSSAMNPVYSIGNQIRETVKRNRGRELPFGANPERLLRRVNIPSPKAALRRYPHQLSGGMMQRVMIAMAVAPGPKLILADEPTTALDRTTRAGVIELFAELTGTLGTSVLFISHDISMLAGVADRLAVMYAGRLVEIGPTDAVTRSPMHPYTRGLLACLPQHAMAGRPLTTIRGTVPRPDRRPTGCSFRDRCDLAQPGCELKEPSLTKVDEGRWVACPVVSRP